jgi:hypothetical protein
LKYNSPVRKAIKGLQATVVHCVKTCRLETELSEFEMSVTVLDQHTKSTNSHYALEMRYVEKYD